MVNRIWQWHFGQGFVRTPNDFGRQGEAPSHPQLLDWLATEFVARGWSMKSMHWLMMTSSAYQMSSLHSDPEARLLDPDNRFLWRMNRSRLEAEALWDAMLSAAGDVESEDVWTPGCSTAVGGRNGSASCQMACRRRC